MTQSNHLDRAVDPARDHVLGSPDAEMTLLEYGSYASSASQAAHEVVAHLRDRFGDRLRYVFRHEPIAGQELAEEAAVLAEYAGQTEGRFWPVHVALMRRSGTLDAQDLERIAAGAELPAERDQAALAEARRRVREDRESAARSGARVAPTFFIGERRYDGPWDEGSLSDALLGALGHRVQAAAVDFVHWGPSAGIALLLMSVLAVVLANSSIGARFEAFWQEPFALQLGGRAFAMPLFDWINEGLLTFFFLVVGLEIKREFTVGRLSTRRAAALPIAASFGGMVLPALIYVALAPSELAHGWGTTISTDTAFAIALIVFLGERVPVELRVFLTAAAIVDDLVAIVVVAVFYSGTLGIGWLAAAAVVCAGLAALNRWGFYGALPYAVLGVLLWACLHGAGIDATLAGVVVAVATPTRPPANLRALNAQAQLIFRAEARNAADELMRHGPSEPAMRMLDTIHDRIESPAAKLLRSVEPWSSYAVLPLFALANAGVVLNAGVFEGHVPLMLAISLGLVVGKPLGIFGGAWLAARVGLAEKPAAYNWRQLFGAGALAGIGFTMSLFIAGRAFPAPADFAAAKIAVFLASITAAALGSLILWHRPAPARDAGATAPDTA
jgi:NhaA family Na+:H+ antiporter